MEKFLNENFDGLKPKKSRNETLQRWGSFFRLVKKPRRRFRYTADLSKRSEAAAERRKLQEKIRISLMVARNLDAISQRESEAVPLVETTREKSSLRKIYKYAGLAELPASFPRFGPVYYDAGDDDTAKEEAWKHLLDKFPNGDQDRVQKTEDIYLDAFGRVEEEARACYADTTLEGLSESHFQWMMIKDGCFFLQLVLSFLGLQRNWVTQTIT